MTQFFSKNRFYDTNIGIFHTKWVVSEISGHSIFSEKVCEKRRKCGAKLISDACFRIFRQKIFFSQISDLKFHKKG